ncbi:11216_t:CDS:10 [Entrophospora sp. SA101]|nr:11216_t:CDS:10 [Entrophospora sp. SA101]
MTDFIESSKEQTDCDTAADSLTLGQLRKIVKQFPNKQKTKEFGFNYSDCDVISNEIDEFYSYVEIRQCLDNKKEFEDGFKDSWIPSTISERRTYIEYLLEILDFKDPTKRLSAAKQLLYIAQGVFGETSSKEHHIEIIIENNKLLWKSGALLSYFQALKMTCRAHDYYSRLDNVTDRQAYIDDVNTEIGFYLTLIYMLVEVNLSDENFGNELIDLDPPMTVFLFETVASLREKDKNVKGYPVKKLLLLLWKVILASLGGVDDIKKKKDTMRMLNGLPPVNNNKEFLTKSTPFDYQTFQSEATQKYPTYAPPPFSAQKESSNIFFYTNNNNNINFSTNSNSSEIQPFIFPFSKSEPTIPKSIMEAGDLYLKFMYTSLSAIQSRKIKEEMKLNHPDFNINGSNYNEMEGIINNDASLPLLDNNDSVTQKDKEKLGRRSILPYMNNIVVVLLKLLLATISSNTNNNKGTENNDPQKGNATNNFNEVDIIRHREITSKAVSAILLLILKHLKVSHVLKFEYLSQLLIDSNCLLLILKMFGLQDISVSIKAKNEVEDLNFFHYCRKVKDNPIQTLENNSIDNFNFTGNNNYSECSSPSSKVQGRSEKNGNLNLDEINDVDEVQSNYNSVEGYNEINMENNIETIIDLDFSWRNFFTAINFLRIAQKLTKKKTHRILLLVQYKSSAILKKILKVSHPTMELYALKVLKNQMPFIGRKWRQNNMKLITAIYLKCRPDLRDEWISSPDPQEQNLRALVKFYNDKYYFINYDDHQSNGIHHNGFDEDSTEIFPPHYTKPLDHTNSAYIDDILLENSFIDNWENWLQEEVYKFSLSKPHLVNIDEFYNDEYSTIIEQVGDGSEWEIPPTPPCDDVNDCFSNIEWKKFSQDDLDAYENSFKATTNATNKYKSNYINYMDDDEIDNNLENVDLSEQIQADIEIKYPWPDEVLGPHATDEVMIYEPISYKAGIEDE